MKPTLLIFMLALLFSCSSNKNATTDGWVPLFNGKDLSGWRASENPATFKVEDGAIVVHGPRAHLFYEGSVSNHNFTNFEFKAQVKTMPSANSGIFFHTAYQETGWPEKGYEAQVNNSQSDWRRTGSLYSFQDIREVYVKDGEWFTETIRVEGKRVTVQINGKTVVDYTEPDGVEKEKGRGQRRLSSGTFALQGHDPNSKVYFKDIYVKPLP